MTKKKIPKITDAEVIEIQENYNKDLSTNPEFSLEVDPQNKYNFTKKQKLFLEYYIQFKNIPMAAELAKIDMDEAKAYFVSYNSQQEIRRINRAMYHRQFQAKLLSLDDIGGYLSSLLTDENVPIANQLSSKDKLLVVKLLLEVNQIKKESILEPMTLINSNIESKLRDLSIDTIQTLLNEVNSQDNSKPKLTLNSSLTPEEKEYLNTLPTEELIELIEKGVKS